MYRTTLHQKSYTPTKEYIKKLKNREFTEKLDKMKKKSQIVDNYSLDLTNRYESKLDNATNAMIRDLGITQSPYNHQKLDLPKFNPGKYGRTPLTPQKVGNSPAILKYYEIGGL